MKQNFLTRHFTPQLGLASLGLLTGTQAAAQQDNRPNIIFIMVDDLGFSDIGSYGASDIQTPNLDRLANEGIRFRQFYNNSISAPTRASLITGQYQHNAGMGFFERDLGDPHYGDHLRTDVATFGEVLQQAGYTTLLSGKWNVGAHEGQRPWERGFDHYFGFLGAASLYYTPPQSAQAQAPRRDGNAPRREGAPNGGNANRGRSPFGVQLFKDGEPYKLEEGKYLTQEIGSHAVEFIGEASKKDSPFFLYLAFNAPHWPLQALPEDIAKYKGVYDGGWDSLRTLRYENAKRLGVVRPNQELTRQDTLVSPWSSQSVIERAFWAKRQEVYAAMVDRVDQEVGRVIDKLKEVGRDQNTIIFFISDNGAQGGGERGLARQIATGEVGTPGSYHQQNSNWSQAGVSPFRNYKSTPYEGGIASPFIAWYPAQIEGGRIVDGVGHIIDVAPTFYDLAKAKYPKKLNGQKILPLAGKSLVPVLTGKTDVVNRGEPLFWEWAGNKAVLDGKWKYVTSDPDYKDELYDIENDRAENYNVAAEHPEIVAQLKQKFEQWAKKNNVKTPYPSNWPHFRW